MTDALDQVLSYHRRTKHAYQRYARGPGYLDWATQPDPFRRYRGAPLVALEHVPPSEEPSYRDTLAGALAPLPLNRRTLSRLLYDSLALSAWKQAGSSRWALRVNPSSGNLHPTEGYVLCGPVEGLADRPMVTHYAPKEHGLEVRASIPEGLWRRLTARFPDDTLLVGLSSIHWREAWKYGERAYRYCQHDVGHAIATVSIAAAGLGWETVLLDDLSSEQVATLLGIAAPGDAEREHPDCLLAVCPRVDRAEIPALSQPDMEAFTELEWQGTPNQLSPRHVAWTVIDEVAASAVKPVTPPHSLQGTAAGNLQLGPEGAVPLRPIIHRRRSAVAMDGQTEIHAETFWRVLASTLPSLSRWPFQTLTWAPHVHLALFVHRVVGVAPGLYMLVRNPGDEEALRVATDSEFRWSRPAGCPETLPLYALATGDAQELARQLSCHQDIASDGCFSLGMLARFEPALKEHGPWFYPRLYWECGMIGQVLYLGAVASGIAATGIGCFFDDPVHQALILEGTDFQSLYHFTVGGALEDTRLTTLPPYSDAPSA